MYVPNAVALTANSYNILNVIRDNASVNYKDYTMSVTNVEDLHKLGNIMMDYQPVANEFVNALMNRIFKVIITSKSYQNPLAFMKKGVLELGETVEEIFVNLCNPQNYENSAGSNEIFKKYKNDVRSAFHTLNYRKYYPISVSRQQLQTAFITESGLTDFINRLIETIYTSVNYDEFLTMKYIIARNILNGRLYPEQVDTENTAKSVINIKSVSNKLEFMSTDYNVAGVYNHTPKDNQYIILKTDFDANVDVSVLATAFNMDKAQFMGHRLTIDTFAPTDTKRLDLLFAEDEGYTPLTGEEIKLLENVQAVLIDGDYLQIYDNLIAMQEAQNGVSLHWNYFYHTWKTFSTSPFANAVVFANVESTVTGIKVYNGDVEVSASGTYITMQTSSIKGGKNLYKLTADVLTTGFASKEVKWTVANQPGPYAPISVTQDGTVIVPYTTSPTQTTATGSIRVISVANPQVWVDVIIKVNNGSYNSSDTGVAPTSLSLDETDSVTTGGTVAKTEEKLTNLTADDTDTPTA